MKIEEIPGLRDGTRVPSDTTASMPPTLNPAILDLNGDSAIDGTDVSILALYLAGKIPCLPVAPDFQPNIERKHPVRRP